MPVTTNFAIPYPDGTTSLTPLQDRFADIANAVDSAMLSGLAGAPRLITSDAQRATVFPSPVQGNMADRPDKGYIEVYLAAYNASTNPGGVATAGWYPLPGTLLGSVFSNPAYLMTTATVSIPSFSMTAYAPGTPILLSAILNIVNSNSGATRTASLQMYEDGIAIGNLRPWTIPFVTGVSTSTAATMQLERTPTAGIHTYTIQGSASLANAVTIVESSFTAVSTARKV